MAILSQNQDDFLNEKRNHIEKIFHYRSSYDQGAFYYLRDYPIWVVSQNKIPKQLNDAHASISDPNTWVGFKKIKDHVLSSEDFPAIALCGVITQQFSIPPICCIDLDNCLDSEGVPSDFAKEVMATFPSYTEISVSGKGLHIFFQGKKPGRACKGNNFEFYDSYDKKFITITGNILPRRHYLSSIPEKTIHDFYFKHFPEKEQPQLNYFPSPPLSNAEIIALLNQAHNHHKFQKLFYDGDISDYNGDASSADFALVCSIAFYSQKHEQVIEIFKESALYKNPERQFKWARSDYSNNTIAKAINSLTCAYQPAKKPLHNGVSGSWEEPAPLDFSENTEMSFPIDGLPDCLRDAILEVARFACVDPSIPLIPALGMLCLSAGKKILIQEKPGLLHHPSLFLVGVMESGDRKSTVYECSLSLIMEEIENERPDFEKKKAEIDAFNELIKESSDEIKKGRRSSTISKEAAQAQLKELYASKRKPPAEPENFADDITSARLFQKLHLHNGTFGVFSSDARKIFSRIIGRGSSEASSEEDLFVSAVWGDTIYRSRVGGGDVGQGEDSFIRKPALTVCALIQRDLWKDFATNKTMRDSGLVARVCVVNPVSHVGKRLESEDDLPFDTTRLKSFSDAVIKIRRWTVEKPVCIRLSQEAAKERRTFFNEIEKESGPGGRYEDVRDIASRITSITTRIAGALALLEAAAANILGNSLPDITLIQWLRAQQLGEYFFAQSLDMQRRTGKQGFPYLLQKAARWLIKQIVEGISHTSLALFKNRVRGLDDDETALKIITSLEKAGWIRQTEQTRKDSISYEINPQISKYKDAD